MKLSNFMKRFSSKGQAEQKDKKTVEMIGLYMQSTAAEIANIIHT